MYYLYNITKKEVTNGVHFWHADKHQWLYKLALTFFMEVARHVQSNQKKLVIFSHFIKKKVSQLLLCCFVMQNIRIFYGVSDMFVVTCFSVLLVSQRSQHFLTWLLIFSNSKILIVLIILCPIPSLNWDI